MARQRPRRHKPYRSRRGRFGPLYKVLSALAIVAAIVVACVVFFRVNEIVVEGNQRYTDEEVITASGIQIGDNLITLPRSRVASSIRTKLPYVGTVAIQHKLPDTVLLRVSERLAAASVDSAEGRWLISAQGKLLESAGADATAMQVDGLTALGPFAGGDLQVPEEEQATMEYVLELLSAFEEHDMLSKCTHMDCTGLTTIEVDFDIYRLRLPRGGDYPRMILMLEGALASDQMPQDAPGLFDFTVEEGKLHFNQGEWNARPEPAPEPEPEPEPSETGTEGGAVSDQDTVTGDPAGQ